MLEKKRNGRPPKYRTPQALQEKIDEYFESCWVDKVVEVTDKDGNVTATNSRYQNRPYTVAGLAWHLGFNSRQSLLNYDANKKFLDVIKKAKLKIEMNVEEFLVEGKNAAGPIFWLKNHASYRDKQEVEFPDADGKPQTIGLMLSDMERATRLVYLLEQAAKKAKADDGTERSGKD